MTTATRTLLPLIAVSFLSSLGFSVVMPFLVFLVTGLGGNAFVMGVIGAAFSASQLVGAPWLGGLSDRLGRKRVLFYSQLGGLIAWAVFVFALLAPHVELFRVASPLTGSFVVLLPVLLIALSRATNGLINGSISVANAYLADVTSGDERKSNFARLGAAASLGFVIGPFAAGFVARGKHGVLLLVLVAMSLSGVGAFVVWRFLPSVERSQLAPADVNATLVTHKALGGGTKECVAHRPSGHSLAELFALPEAKRMIGLYFLVFLGFSIFTTVLPMHALVDLHWTSDRLGAFFGVLSLALITTQVLVLPPLARRFSDGALAAWGSATVALAYVLVASLGVPGAFGAATLYGVGNGLMWPSYLAMLSETGPASARGRLQGVASSAGSVASITGMLGGGGAFATLGSKTFFVAAASLATAVVVFMAKPRVRL